MDINKIQDTLQKLKKCKIPQSEIAKALKKDRSNINAKAKRGTELKLSEVQKDVDFQVFGRILPRIRL